MAIIAVDFDSTLIESDGGEYYALPGAAEALERLRQQGHRIIIHTCRTGLAAADGELEAEVRFIEQCLKQFGIPYDEIFLGEKLVAHIYIDDRAVAFDGDWESTEQEVSNRVERWRRRAG